MTIKFLLFTKLFLASIFVYTQTIENRIDSIDQLVSENNQSNKLLLERLILKLDLLKYKPKKIAQAKELKNEIHRISKNESIKVMAELYFAEGLQKAGEFNQSDSVLTALKDASISKEMRIQKEYLQLYNSIYINGKYSQILARLKLLDTQLGEAGASIIKTNIVYAQALCHYHLGHDDQALELLYQGLNLTEDVLNLDSSKFYNLLAIVHMQSGNTDDAMAYYLKALQTNEKLGNNEQLIRNYVNIGILLYQMEKFDEGLAYLNEGYQLAHELGSDFDAFMCELNMVYFYTDTENYKSALEFSEKALKSAQKLGLKGGYMVNVYHSTSETYLDMGDLKNAKTYIDKTIALCREFDDQEMLALTEFLLAKWHHKQGNRQEALNLLDGIADSKRLIDNHKQDYLKVLELQYKIYQQQGEYRNAFNSHVRYKALSDSLINESNIQKITTLSLKYKFNKERDSIHLANQEVQLQKEHELSQQRNLNLFLIGGLVIVLAMSILLYCFYLQKKKINAKLKKQRNELDQSYQLNKKILTIIGHDLKSPLVSLKHLMQLFSYGSISEEEFKEYLERVNNGIDNAYSTLENILKWSIGFESGGASMYNPGIHSINSLIHYSVEKMGEQFRFKNIQVHANLSTEFAVLIDKNQILTVIRNLLNNAIKFTEYGGNITIMAEEVDGHCVVSISDDGVGMDAESVPKLFAPKQKTNNSQMGTANETGCGLGLILCKEFINNNKGKIWIESEKNLGTTVYFSLNLAKNSNKTNPITLREMVLNLF